MTTAIGKNALRSHATRPMTPGFDIEMMEGHCDPAAAQLWQRLHGPSCAATRPAVCLVARRRDNGQMLGVAQYFRTFPPEEGCGAVVIVPEARHSGVGDALLARMVDHAVHSGIRVLGTVAGDDDLTTMELLRAANLPIVVSRMDNRLYVEIDAFHGAHPPITAEHENQQRPESALSVPAASSKEFFMEASSTLQAEHNAVLYVLDQLDRAGTAAAAGRLVPQEVFSDMEEFFRIFVTQCHHGKEEAEVFPKLIAAGEPLPLQLEKEHEHGRQMEQAYARAVAGYSPGNASSGATLEQAAIAYSTFLRRHIATETAELFPAMERHLQAADRALTEAFERIESERIGAGVHERLHGMIDGLGARIDTWMELSKAQ